MARRKREYMKQQHTQLTKPLVTLMLRNQLNTVELEVATLR